MRSLCVYRQMGKNKAVTEVDVESITMGGSQGSGRQLRRSTRGNR